MQASRCEGPGRECSFVAKIVDALAASGLRVSWVGGKVFTLPRLSHGLDPESRRLLDALEEHYAKQQEEVEEAVLVRIPPTAFVGL